MRLLKLDSTLLLAAERFVSDVKGMKASAEALIQAAGSAGLNYVVGCSLTIRNMYQPIIQFLLQNGVPSGTIRENADG